MTKPNTYLQTGRDLDTHRKYQSEYEAAFHLVQRSSEEELFPFILYDGSEKAVHLSYSDYYRLQREPENLILDRGSDRGSMLYFQKNSISITGPFSTLIKQLAFTDIPPSDEEWCNYVYQDLQRVSSFRNTIDRIRRDLKFEGFPDLLARKHNKFYWIGPPLHVVEKV